MCITIQLTHYVFSEYKAVMKLRDWRKLRGLTTTEAAQLLGLSQPTISRIERGQSWPNRVTMERIAVVTENAVTANDFVQEQV